MAAGQRTRPTAFASSGSARPHEAFTRRDQVLSLWEKTLRDGAAALGAGSPAGARVAETAAFFEFLQGEMPAMMDHWRNHREKLGLG
ncbi:hypothetical protein ACIPYQ_30760 [Streptomyces sp. NPDC090045]|uniref:hypothetical protein n=1 Tax=Streptomyces sp. NPDC090045 TaxID=3365927 RepID=UPI003809DC17